MWFSFLGILLCSIAALLVYAHRATYRPHVKQLTIPIRKQTAAIDDTRRLNILHLSDLHMEKISISPEKLYQQIHQQPVDLIALTGDYLDKPESLEKLKSYLSVLKTLNPSLGIYAVLGNHDYVLKGEDFVGLVRLFEEMDIELLRNENRRITCGEHVLSVVGIDDAFSGHDDVEQAFRGVHADDIRLVLSHDPHIIFKMEHFPHDYLLSGHFHGGQIHWPKAFHLKRMGPLPQLDIIKGLHYYRERPFYISEGLGQTGINIRLRSRPEITFHQLLGIDVCPAASRDNLK